MTHTKATSPAQAVRCPRCNDRGTNLERVARSAGVKRYLWGSKKYACHRCGGSFLRFMGMYVPH